MSTTHQSFPQWMQELREMVDRQVKSSRAYTWKTDGRRMEFPLRRQHMYECAVLGIVPDEFKEEGVPWVATDYRACLLQVGRPYGRYHRRGGTLDENKLLRRIEYIDSLSDFCMGYFGTIGAHGSFVPRFAAAYEDWFYTVCKEKQHGND